jgi:hypothetical protein
MFLQNKNHHKNTAVEYCDLHLINKDHAYIEGCNLFSNLQSKDAVVKVSHFFNVFTSIFYMKIWVCN